ncbi:MAG: hypothetical protein RR387_01460, partial [Clostridiales bacterium]
MSASLAILMYAFMGSPLVIVVINNILKKETAQKCCLSLVVLVGVVKMSVAVISFILLNKFGKLSI